MEATTAYSIGGLPLPGSHHLSLGPKHPSESGVIGATVREMDGRIVAVDIQPGYLHRGAEKLFEVRDYRSAIMLADRHDWLSSFSGELVVTQTIEDAMGLTPPPRAVWLRALLAEYARLHSHLSYLSYLDRDLWPIIERLRDGLLSWSGNRVHPMLNRVGGLAADIPEGWIAATMTNFTMIGEISHHLKGCNLERFAGIGRVDQQLCRDFALSGPVARAAGLEMDSRPLTSAAYARVFEPTPLHTEGDAKARFLTLVDELGTSCTMIQRLADDVPDGPINVKLSRRLKVPEGEHISRIEAPWGIAEALLVSRGGQTPWRLALRTPTFANVSALGTILVGARTEQIADVVASMGYAIGDLDK